MVNKKPAHKALPSPAADAAGDKPPCSDIDQARNLALSMAKVAEPNRKFSADYLLELEEKRIGLRQAANEFLAGLERYQWLIDAIMKQKAEHNRLKAIDPEHLTNPVERCLAFANMARMTNQVMRALAKENADLVKVAMEGIAYAG